MLLRNYIKFKINKLYLKRYWIFYCGKFLSIFKSNYKWVKFFHGNRGLLSLTALVQTLRQMSTLFLNLKRQNQVIIGTDFLYVKNWGIDYPPYRRSVKIFSNFSAIRRSNILKTPSLKPGIGLFIGKNARSLLFHAKELNIITFGLTPTNVPVSMVDYSVITGARFFYSVYFFYSFFNKVLSCQRK